MHTSSMAKCKLLSDKCPLLSVLDNLISTVTPEIEIEGVENGRVAPEAGRDVQLACTARGYPVPTVSWTRGGVEISTTPTLLLPTISQADNGTYTCVATNRAGTAEQRADVVVVGKV